MISHPSGIGLVLSILDLLFFFLLIRRPPRSTPFPTRRSSDLSCCGRIWQHCSRRRVRIRPQKRGRSRKGIIARSEEHTSELQSRRDLVCRLLLEKKKKLRSNVRYRSIICSAIPYYCATLTKVI